LDLCVRFGVFCCLKALLFGVTTVVSSQIYMGSYRNCTSYFFAFAHLVEPSVRGIAPWVFGGSVRTLLRRNLLIDILGLLCFVYSFGCIFGLHFFPFGCCVSHICGVFGVQQLSGVSLGSLKSIDFWLDCF